MYRLLIIYRVDVPSADALVPTNFAMIHQICTRAAINQLIPNRRFGDDG